MNIYEMMEKEKENYVERYKRIKKDMESLSKTENKEEYFCYLGQLTEIKHFFVQFFGSDKELNDGFGLVKAIYEAGFGQYFCSSFEEAENNDRKKNIVIIDDSEIYLTYKMDGVFGEFVSWSEDEMKETPNLIETIVTCIKEVYTLSDDVIKSRYGVKNSSVLSFTPYDQASIEVLPINIAKNQVEDNDDDDDGFECLGGFVLLNYGRNKNGRKINVYRSTETEGLYCMYDIDSDSSIAGSLEQIVEDMKYCKYNEKAIGEVKTLIEKSML